MQGEVQVEGARGKVNVSSVNEKVTISNTSGEITAESVNGAITMTGIESKSVDATTVNGTIQFEGKLVDGGHYSFDSHNGDVLLGVPETSNATFTLRTYNGSFSTDFPLELQPRGDAARTPRHADARQRQRGRGRGDVRGRNQAAEGDRRTAARTLDGGCQPWARRASWRSLRPLDQRSADRRIARSPGVHPEM